MIYRRTPKRRTSANHPMVLTELYFGGFFSSTTRTRRKLQPGGVAGGPPGRRAICTPPPTPTPGTIQQHPGRRTRINRASSDVGSTVHLAVCLRTLILWIISMESLASNYENVSNLTIQQGNVPRIPKIEDCQYQLLVRA
ncbi:uncharacterized protein LOC143687066 [Tamandua tetradactyla]|uniref:uncharacterized protein LOC143687066 n=1 Tax=Tamandua tetradactyla TaxID=48850 RepID=UPI00405408F1